MITLAEMVARLKERYENSPEIQKFVENLKRANEERKKQLIENTNIEE